jgi:hypothetical protein
VIDSRTVSLAVDRLTLTTKQMARSDDRLVFYDAAPLLEELTNAVTPSGEKSGSSSPSVAGLPVSVDALDLLLEIEEGITSAYWETRTLEERPAPVPSTAMAKLRYIGDRVAESTEADRLEGPGIIRVPCLWILEDAPRWVTRIELMFDPPKVVPIPEQACPICRHDRTSVQTEPGVFVSSPALTMILGPRPAARCGECGAVWTKAELLDFARAVHVEV